jgi:hypothetical protein
MPLNADLVSEFLDRGLKFAVRLTANTISGTIAGSAVTTRMRGRPGLIGGAAVLYVLPPP